MYRRQNSHDIIRSAIFVGAAVLLVAGKQESQPWSVSIRDPVVTESRPTDSVPSTRDGTIGRDYALLLLKFYQNILSVVVHSRCRMLPTCSNYSIAAIRKHGPLLGIMMTIDRLIREGHEQREAPVVIINGCAHFRDPVEANDFWWYREPETHH
ncbi:MAG: membrane protein insertion efficiency factor YidD [Verrucomicrobia bacterium]|nr:MAG: membrane protein insertion efficiency factor YidD [Verrucomicrobiota bacterium]